MDTRHEVGNNTNMSSAQLIGTRHTSLIILALATTAALAQVDDSKAQIEQLEAQLESSWWITVEAERGQRIMRVTSIGSRGDGNFAVDLNYGILGGFLGPLKATLFRQSPPLTVNPQEWIGSKTFRIEFITGAGTQISAESAAPGTFVGTFTPRSGRTKQITFEQTAMFYFPANDYCMGTVPADVRVDGQGMLVFVFDSMRAGCAQFQYTFDPVLRSGSIRQRPAGSPPETPWSRPSGAKISLIE